MDLKKVIDHHKEQVSSIISMQELIFNLTSDNYEESSRQLGTDYDFNDKTVLRHVLATIGVAFQTRPTISDILIQLICSFSSNINDNFMPHEIYNILLCNSSNYLLLELINHHILTFPSICSIPHDESNSFLIYFSPEIQQNDQNKFNTEVKPLLTIDDEKHQELRSKGVNEFPIAELIRNDDLEGFIESLSRSSSINSKIPYSIYEKCSYINKEPSYFEYAAFYGSVKIFKYLVSNKISPSNNLAFFAVAGGNFEIIHICEQINCDFTNAINAALLFHQKDIFNYLVNQEFDFLYNSVIFCIEGYNFEYFYQLFDRNNYDKNQEICDHESLLIYTMKHLYSEFCIALISLSGLDFNRVDIFDCTAIHWSVYNYLNDASNCMITQNSIDLNRRNCLGVFFLFN